MNMRKVLLKLSLLFIMLGLKSQATVFFVQHHSDGLFPSPQFTGSLRECITLANSGTPASPDIIIDTVTTSSSITLVAQLPNITTSVIINGANSTGGILTVKAFNSFAFNIFNIGSISGIAGSQYVELNKLRIQNGFTVTLGGGINVQNCTLTLNNCEVNNNGNFNGLGGGIYAGDAILNINNCTVANNTINNGAGGGIYFGGSFGSFSMINSTVFGNSALSGSGGGIDFNSAAPISVINSTIVQNSAVDGGGIFINQNEILLENSIVANNTKGATGNGADIFKTNAIDVMNGVNSNFGHNLIGDTQGFSFNPSASISSNVTATDVTQIVSNTLSNANSITQYLMPTACSPTIDAGVSVNPPITDLDQRGVGTTNIKDIGAIEYPALIVADQTACGPTTFTLTVSGGTSTTSPIYNWYQCETCSTVIGTGSSFVTPIISAPDSFYVAEVTNCTDAKRYKVRTRVFPIPPTPTILAVGYAAGTDTIVLCNNGPTATLTSSSVLTGLYSWNTLPAQSTQSIIESASGSYVVTITDGNNCSASSEPFVIISVAPPLTPVITSSIGATGTSICATDTATLTATTSSTPITHYEWTLIPSSVNVNGSDTLVTIEAVDEGNYSVTVYSGPACFTQSVPFLINHNSIPLKPSVIVGGATTFCIGDSVLLSSSDLVNTNTWNTVPVSISNSITVKDSGFYFTTVTDANLCKNYSDTIQITVNVPLKPLISYPNTDTTTFCAGDSITVTSTPSASYLWSNGQTTQTIVVKSSTANLSVTTTDINGCSSTSDSLQITVIPITTPIITALGSTTFCDGGSVVIESDQPAGNTWSPNGENTSSINITQSGNYYVTIPGCSDTSNVINVTVNPNPIIPTIINTNPLTFCDGDSVVLVANTPETGLSYTWNDPTSNTNDSLTVKTSGNYSITVTNTFGCSTSSSATSVVVNPLPTTPIATLLSPSNTICLGDSVLITSNLTQNNIWNNGDTTQVIVVKTSGSYFVQTTDLNNCASNNSNIITVIVNAPAIPNITADDTLTFCDGDSVHLTSSIPSNIQWSNGATSQTITVLVSGTYFVEALDAGNGCVGKSNDTVVTVLPTTQPTVSASGNTSFCDGDSVTLSSSSSSGNQWFLNGGILIGETSNTITVQTTGNYTVSLPGCAIQSNPIPVTVNSIPAPPTIIPLGSTIYCSDKSVTLLSSYPNPGNVWSTSETNQSIILTGKKTITLTYTDFNGCSSTSLPLSTDTIALPAKPIITTNSGLDVFCTGGSIDLTSNYANNNVWSNSSTNQTINTSVSGTFTVTFTDVNGCSSTSLPKVINEVAPFTPTITLSGNDTICEGQSLTLTSSEAFGNEWSTGDTTQSITISTPGNYNVLLQSCDLPSDSVKVTVLALPTKPNITAVGPTTLCQGDSTLLVSDIDNVQWSISTTIGDSIYANSNNQYFAINTNSFGCLNYSDTIAMTVVDTPNVVLVAPTAQCGGIVPLDAGFPGSTYLWSNGATTQQIDVSVGGPISVTVTNTCGSFTSNTINVPINLIPVVDLGADIQQCGGTVTLDALNSGSSYSWSTTENLQAIIVSSTGTYSVTVTTADGCTATDEININLDGTLPVVNLGSDINQCGSSTVLNAGNPLATYSWYLSATPTSILSNNQSINISTSGNYVASVTNGCGTSTDTVLVSINTIPVVNLATTTNACNTIATLNAQNTGSSFLWNTGETNQAIDVSTSGNYCVTVTSAEGCTASDCSDVILSTIPPFVNIGPDGTYCTDSLVLDAGNIGSVYTWILPNSSIQNTQTITALTSGLYVVLVNNGCGTDIDSININLSTPINVDLGGIQNSCVSPILLDAGVQSPNSIFDWTFNGSAIANNNQTFLANFSGNYSVTVTNTAGCSATSTAAVTIDAPLALTPISAPSFSCGPITITAGSYPASTHFQWFNNGIVLANDTLSNLSITSSGSYSVLITNNCGGDTSNSVVITLLPDVTVDLGNDTTTCLQSVTLDAGVQTQGSTFVWFKNGQTINNASSQSYTATSSGNYSVVVTNLAGCSNTSDILVNIDSLPNSLNILDPAPACGLATLDAGSYTTGTVFVWTSLTSNSVIGNSQTIDISQTDSVFVTVSNSCGNITSNHINVQIITAPTVDLGNDTAVCINPVLLDAGIQPVGTSFSWSNSAGPIQNATAQTLLTTITDTYTVTVTNIAGCSSNSTVNVTIDNVPTVPIISSPDTACSSATIISSSYPTGTSYQWYSTQNGIINTNGNQQNYIANQSGSYYVIVTNSCGQSNSDTLDVVILGSPIVSLGNDTTTCQASVTLDAGQQSVGSSYSWTQDGNATGTSSSTLTVTVSGQYGVTVTNNAGCSTTDLINVSINNLPVVNTISDPAATCDSVIVDGGLYANGISYTWLSSNNNIIGNSQLITLNSTDSIRLVLSNSCGTDTSNFVHITILSIPTALISGNDTSCIVASQLSSGNPVNTSIKWYLGNNLVSTSSTYDAAITGVYSLVVTNLAGCSDSTSLSVVIDTIPTAPLLQDTLIVCGPINIDAGNYPIGTSYAWLDSANNVISNSQIINIALSQTVRVVIYNSCGSDTSNSEYIQILPVPVVNLGGPYSSCIVSVPLNAGVQLAGSTYTWYNGNTAISGETSSTYNASETGVYSLVVSNLAGCSDSASVSVTIDTIPLAPNLNAPLISCGDFTLDAGAYPPGTTYQWYNQIGAILNANQSTYTVTASGSYNVMVINSCGSATSDTADITILPSITVDLGSDTATCEQAVLLDAGVQTSGSTFVWYRNNNIIGSQTSQLFTALQSGNYKVVVSNIAGCSDSSSVNVSIDSLPVAQAIPSPINACGSVILDAGSYTSGSTITWYDVNNVQISTGQFLTLTSSANVYAIISNNCGSDTTNNVLVNLIDTPIVNIGGPYSSCISSGVLLDAGTQLSSSSISWFKNTTLITNALNSQTLQINDLGSYSVTVVVTNANGCSATATAAIQIDSLIAVPVLTQPAAACGLINMTISQVQAGTSIQWYQNGIALGTNASQTFTNSGAVYVVLSNNCSTDTSNTVNIVVDSAPVVNLGGPFNQCGGVSLSAGTQQVGSSFSWTNLSGSTLGNASSYFVSLTDTVILNVTSPNGTCISSDTVIVNTAVGAPTVTLQSSINSCGPVILAAGNLGSTYQWYNGSNAIIGATASTYTVTAAGQYSVVVTNACGVDTSNVSTITVNPAVSAPVIISNGPTIFCSGNDVTLAIDNPQSGITYTWYPGGLAQSTITVNSAGVYYVTAQNAQGCSATSALQQIEVGLPTIPTITASSSLTFCEGDSVILTSSSASNNLWSNGDISQAITVYNPGTYTVVVTNVFNCTSSTSVNVVVNPKPLALITSNVPTNVCSGDTIKLTSAHVGGNVWSAPGVLNGATTQTISYVNTVGSVSFSVTVTEASSGCKATSPIYTFNYVPVLSKPTITATAGGSKCDGTLTLTSSATSGNLWFNGATSQSITINSVTTAWVQVQASNGCISRSDDSLFQANNGSTMTLALDQFTAPDGIFNTTGANSNDGYINLTVNGGVPSYTYVWSRDTITKGTVFETDLSFTATTEDLTSLDGGYYFVTVTDLFGCVAKDSIFVNEPKAKFKVPDGISPNADGSNDVYIIGSIEKYPDNRVDIYNRWGSKVFSIDGYNNNDKAWKGQNNSGNDLPEGTYYVVITVNSENVTIEHYCDLKR
jgi:gliding motility-associated-like protein